MKYGALFAVLALHGTALAQPGMDPETRQAPTRATFVSTTEEQWDVTVDRRPVCSTPCTLGIMPLQFVALRTQEDRPIKLDVGYMPAGELMVSAKPLRSGLYATGIVFTTFSGMGLVTGVTLTAVGCATKNSGLCTAGIVTAIPSAIGLYASIYLMRIALPKAEIGPARPYVSGNQIGLAGTF